MAFSPEFVDRLRAGDPSAFAELMEASASTVRMIVRKYHKSVFEQEEALQEVWLTVFSKRSSLDRGMAGHLEGWVATVARNRCIDLVRSRQRRPEIPTEQVPEAPLEGAANPSHRAAVVAELRRAVDDFAGPLKPQWRAFFELHFVQGQPYSEVSRQLGITRLRCKYMKRVLAAQARQNTSILHALDRLSTAPSPSDKASPEDDHAP